MNDLINCVGLVDLPVKMLSQLAGFEPTRAEPIGFQVQRLNHSATTAWSKMPQESLIHKVIGK